VNATFWFLYGAAKGDIIVWGPNSIGLVLGISQVMLCFIYPKSYDNNYGKYGGGPRETEFQTVSTWDADPPISDDDDDELFVAGPENEIPEQVHPLPLTS
jgi:hypothetical protein